MSIPFIGIALGVGFTGLAILIFAIWWVIKRRHSLIIVIRDLKEGSRDEIASLIKSLEKKRIKKKRRKKK